MPCIRDRTAPLCRRNPVKWTARPSTSARLRLRCGSSPGAAPGPALLIRRPPSWFSLTARGAVTSLGCSGTGVNNWPGSSSLPVVLGTPLPFCNDNWASTTHPHAGQAVGFRFGSMEFASGQFDTCHFEVLGSRPHQDGAVPGEANWMGAFSWKKA